jgi:hypothetical protein
MKRNAPALPLSALLLLGCGGAPSTPGPAATVRASATATAPQRAIGLAPHAPGVSSALTIANGPGDTGNSTGPLTYHGGPVMAAPVHIYFIWYGDWSDYTPDIILLNELALEMGGSAYLTINELYCDSSGNCPTNRIDRVRTSADYYSRGKLLSDGDVQTIVNTKIQNNTFPDDPDGIYFVVASPDVSQYGAAGGSCSTFCGWHSPMTSIHGTALKYGFIFDPASCGGCLPTKTGPNGTQSGDAMASVFAHELVESVTDPYLNAWYSPGQETADKCAWDYGETYSSGGGNANINIGGRDYLLQENWVSWGGGYCSMGIQFPPVILQTDDSLCLDIAGASTSSGARDQSYACHHGTNQVWLPETDGTMVAWAGKCLDVDHANTFNGAVVQEWDCNRGTNQRWYMSNDEVRGAGSGRCMDVTAMVNQNGQPVQLWDCLGYWNQQWTFERDGSIHNGGYKCLEASGLSNGAPVYISDCNGSLGQKWEYRPNGEIQGMGGRCLDATAYGTSNGTPLQLWDCLGGANQIWSIKGPVESGLGKCLDVTSGDPSHVPNNNDLAQLWDCTGSDNQTWTLSPY